MDQVELPTLDYFLADPHSRNAYVEEPGFDDLYVRKGRRYLAGETYDRVVDLANITATNPGMGALTTLITRLHAKGENLYVESILNDRLVNKLYRMGFIRREGVEPPCMYLLANDPLIKE